MNSADGRRHQHHGYRGRGRGHHHGNHCHQRQHEGEDQQHRGRPPPGLKGREIGLWYRDKMKQHKDKTDRPVINMNRQQEDQLAHLLYSVKNSENADDTEMDTADVRGAGPGPADVRGAGPGPADVRGVGQDGFFNSRTLRDDPGLNERLYQGMSERLSSKDKYVEQMLQFRRKLPSYGMRQEIVDLVESNRVILITGETGCGKTTQVAQFILDSYIEQHKGSQCRVVCTQPRRISAISVAERVSAERGERCGSNNSTGYIIRLENKLPREQGSILYCTTGILLKWLESDRSDLKVILMSATLNAEIFAKYFDNCPSLNIPGYTFPVKEYFLEDVIQMTRYRPNDSNITKRKEPRWKQIIRSKRVQTEKERLESQLESSMTGYISTLHKSGSYSDETLNSLEDFDHVRMDLNIIVTLIRYICLNLEPGAILVFVPGWDQISKLNDTLQRDTLFNSGNFLVIPLHSMMPTVNQREVFNRPPDGVRKIVIATNIAETSITIDDVVYVVDNGYMKEKNFDIETGIATLRPEWTSKANSTQRMGRAGRVQAGVCYHLFTQFRHSICPDYQQPEMLRSPLEELCLQIKSLGLGDIHAFVAKSVEPPSLDGIQLAIDTLKTMKALDDSENLTPLGWHLAKLPVEPRIGKMILFAAMFSCLDPVLTVAACLSFKDPFVLPLGKEEEVTEAKLKLSHGAKSDHLTFVYAFKSWEKACKRGESNMRRFCWEHYLSPNTLQMISNMKVQFCEYLRSIGFVINTDPKHTLLNKHSDNEAVIRAVLCAGLYPRVAKITQSHSKRKPSVKLHVKDIGRVYTHPKSVNNMVQCFTSKWLIYYELVKSSDKFIHDCSEVSPYPLLFFGGEIGQGSEEDQSVITVDDWIVFQATPTIASLVQELRVEFDKLLHQKVKHPSVTEWIGNSTETRIMKAIRDLIITSST